MSSRHNMQQPETGTVSGSWLYWFLPGCLLLLALLQTLPEQSIGSKVVPLGAADHVQSDASVLLSSRETPAQVRGGERAGTNDRPDSPQKQFFTFYLLLAVAGNATFFFIFAAYRCSPLLPVQTLPGAPRGPPVGA